MKILFNGIFVILFVYVLMLLAYYCYCGIVALFEIRARRRQQALEDYDILAGSMFTLPVSILIPAHNEERGILNTVSSALRIEYPEFEVIVIDDGSTDGTFELLRSTYALAPKEAALAQGLQTGTILQVYQSAAQPRLSVIRKESGLKKAGAMNAGVAAARYPYVCELDGDTLLEPRGLLEIMAHVNRDPEHIIGVGCYFGLVNGFKVDQGRIIERSFSWNPLIAYQNIEYIRAFLGTRTVWSRFNASPVISGGFALWRRDILLTLGGFSPEHSAEDVEIAFRAQEFIKSHPAHRLLILPYCAGWTDGPTTLGALLKQRDRWQRCVLESTWQYRRMVGNPAYGSFGLFTLPYFLLYEALGVFFETGGVVLTLYSWGIGIMRYKLVLSFLILVAGSQAVISLFSLFAFVRDQRIVRLRMLSYWIVLAMIEIFWYRWVISLAKISGTISFLRGKRKFDQYRRQSARRP